jgi:hypothetical protein
VFFAIINDSEAEPQIHTNQDQSREETTHSDEIKEWFRSLTVEQRLNALTTTSPYLSEILVNMQR